MSVREFEKLTAEIAELDALLDTELDALHAAKMVKNPQAITQRRLEAQRIEAELENIVDRARVMHRDFWLAQAKKYEAMIPDAVRPIHALHRARSLAGKAHSLDVVIAQAISLTAPAPPFEGTEFPEAAPDSDALRRAEIEI
ncbi:MAG: hypothetical protein Q8L89_00985 [Gammaproteobacteria bacterium]|nr:hypothetical protein [Gammaproteobacteria bacterium]